MEDCGGGGGGSELELWGGGEEDGAWSSEVEEGGGDSDETEEEDSEGRDGGGSRGGGGGASASSSSSSEEEEEEGTDEEEDTSREGGSSSGGRGGGLRMEAARLGGESLLLPQGLCDSPDLFRQFFSLDLWNNFSQEEKIHLKNFLPSFPENDEQEKNKTLQMVFNRENIRFGNPLTEFHKHLRAGHYRPDISKMRALLKRIQYKDQKRMERWEMYRRLKSVLSSRQRLISSLLNGEKTPKMFSAAGGGGAASGGGGGLVGGGGGGGRKRSQDLTPNVRSRYFQELALLREEIGETSESSEDESFPEGPLLVKKGRQRSTSLLEVGLSEGLEPVLGTLSLSPSPWEQPGSTRASHSPYSVPEQTYSQILVQHAKRRAAKEEHPDLQTDGITLQDVTQRCSKFLKRPAGSKQQPSAIVKKSKIKIKREPSLEISSPMKVEEELVGGGGIGGGGGGGGEMSEEELACLMLKMEPPEVEEEIESVKVDIEAVEDLPTSLPLIVRQNSSSIHNSPSPPKLSKAPVAKRVQQVRTTESLMEKRLPPPPAGLALQQQLSTPLASLPVLSPVAAPPPPPSSSSSSAPLQVDESLQTSTATHAALLVGPEQPKKPAKVTIIKTEPSEVVGPSSKPGALSRLPHVPATLSDLDGIDMMDLPVDFGDDAPDISFDDMSSHPELMQESHACFFSLIRDILLSTPEHRLEPRELESRVKAWAASPIAPLSPWYSPQLEARLQSAISFLTGDSSEPLPDDYVPYMEWKVGAKVYQWIGAGRDSDHRLVALCSLWGERSPGGPGIAAGGGTGASGVGGSAGATAVGGSLAPSSTPVGPPGLLASPTSGAGPPLPRGPAVQPSSLHDRALFRQQEKQRYETPFRAFTYRVGGLERVVGPVRSTTQVGNLNKARGHSLLVEDRPKYVTILELVRDAVARLPNGQGTRADIVTLLKDSQYLSETAQEGVLSSVVSGVLDRLHYEADPSVKYDSKRKIWVYLHQGRSEEEFERLHALSANVKTSRPKGSRKTGGKAKKDLPKIEMPENTDLLPGEVVVSSAGPSSGGSVTGSGGDSPLGGMQPTGGGGGGVRKLEAVKTLLAVSNSPAGSSKQPQQPRKETAVVKIQAPPVSSQHQQQQQGVTSASGSCLPVSKAGSILPARTIVQDTSLLRTPPHSVVKKTMTLPAETVTKAGGKSLVKVITASQSPLSSTPVRAVGQRTASVGTSTGGGSQVVTSAGQQLIQLKQQFLASGDKIVKAGSQTAAASAGVQQRKQSISQAQPQVIVMKQTSGGGGEGGAQQMIVINQQQILLDSLSVKHQKQLQQLLAKQQATHPDLQHSPQAQAIQLILGKGSVGDGGKGGKGGPMIVVKEAPGGGGGGKGGGGSVQQMILVKQAGGGGGGGEGEGGTGGGGGGQQLQQMILVKQAPPPPGGGGSGGGQGATAGGGAQAGGAGVSQPIAQQMIIVKQQADSKSVQVINPLSAAKGGNQSLSLAQLQQHPQRNASNLLTHPRVVAHVSSSGSSVGGGVMKSTVVTSAGGSVVSAGSGGGGGGGSAGGGGQMVAKVVSSSSQQQHQQPIITMESLLSGTHQVKHAQPTQAAVRLPGVARGVGAPQYAVVSLPQPRVVQTSVAQVSGGGDVVSSGGGGGGGQTVKVATAVGAQGVRIPGLNLAQIAGKQVIVASKPSQATLQGQNVVLGGGGGQALLVGGSGGQQLALLQHGTQQILLPPGAIKGFPGQLKVIPIAPGKTSHQGRQQVFARIINPGNVRQTYTASIVQQDTSQQPPPSSSKD